MKLTPHFSLEELEYSSKAVQNHLENKAPASLVPSLRNLCLQVLEPLRQHAGKPVIISSGYRSPALNRLVGGVKTSQHLKGEAVDIHLYSMKEGREWFQWLKTHVPHDQLIWESKGSKGAKVYWIHVSCKLDISQNRKEVLE